MKVNRKGGFATYLPPSSSILSIHSMKSGIGFVLVLLGWILGPSWAFTAGKVHSTAVLTHFSKAQPPVAHLAMSNPSPGGRSSKRAKLARTVSTRIGLSTYPASIGRASLPVRVEEWAASTISNLRKHVDEVSVWRVAAVTFLSCIFLFRSSLDASLIRLWSYLQHSPGLIARAFRHDHWVSTMMVQKKRVVLK
jgi:hypothetical protein